MPYWREPLPRMIRESRPTAERRVYVLLCGPCAPEAQYEVYFRRWLGPEEWPPFGPHATQHPQLVAEIRDSRGGGYATLDEARVRARALAEHLPNLDDDSFDRRPVPEPPLRLQEVYGADPQLKAWTVQHADGRLEVRCFRYEPIASTPDGSYVEWDWMRQRWEAALFATDMESAEAAAQSELEELRR